MELLSEQDVQAQLEGLPGWRSDGTALSKRFEFDSFGAAMAFMAAAASPIDELDHHPEWTNVYNRVDIRLSSHDAGGITQRDLQLAGILDSIANSGSSAAM